MFCFKLIDTSQGSTHKEGIRKVVTGAEVGKSSFIINASRSRGSKSKKFLFKGLASMIKEPKEFRCKCKQFPPYELLGFPSPPIVNAFFPKKCFGRGDMHCDSIDCYYDDD